MTTKKSPGETSNEMSFTAATQPVFSRSSDRGNAASGEPTMVSAFGPKTFQTLLARMRMGSPPFGACGVAAKEGLVGFGIVMSCVET